MNHQVRMFMTILVFMVFLAQAMKNRIPHQGVLLEPIDKILHGAGQAGITSFDGFEHYWNTAPDGRKPILFMDYFDTHNIKEKWSKELKEELLKYHRMGFYVIPQLGLNIDYYYNDIISGKHEKELNNLVKGFQYLGIPCYFRIGYEFNNNKPWGGSTFSSAFKVIANKLREANLEVATVWNCGLSGNEGIMSYYPGDDVVDWMGFNCFSDIAGGVHCIMLDMVKEAEARGKPVMIGEASPSAVNDPDLSKRWDWYRIYFKMIADQPTIKQMTYINWDWDIQDMVGGNIGFPWGDARMEVPGSVKDQYFDSLANEKFFHASSEKEFRALLGYNDKEPPNPPKNLRKESNFLTWDPAKDKGESQLAHYTIYKDGKLWDYLINTKYPFEDLGIGGTVDVFVTAMDRAGNESEKSNVYKADMVDEKDLIIDGEFDEPLTSLGLDWTFRGTNDNGALPVDEFKHDESGKLSGKYSAHLVWEETVENKKDWKLQFLQAINVEKDREYHISFQAVASREITAKLYFMSHHIDFLATHFAAGIDYKFEEEWNKYNMWEIPIGTTAKEFSFTGIPNKTELGRLSFMFGHLDPTDVWIDNVKVIIRSPVAIDRPIPGNGYANGLQFQVSSLLHKLAQGVLISYTLPEKCKTSIYLYDVTGRVIATIMKKVQEPGFHRQSWSLAHLTPGMYLFSITSGAHTEVEKFTVMH